VKAGFFVAGTDTGVGKTVFSAALLRSFAARGLRGAGMKPVAAGCEGGRNPDVEALLAASGAAIDRGLVCPYLFEPAIAPHIAAREAGVRIDLAVIDAAFRELQTQVDVVVVEGVGGFRVPLNERDDTAGMARRLGLPLMVKPVCEGSSLGMSKVRVAGGLEEAYALAVNYDRVVMAEKFIEGPELTVGILGDEVLPIIKLETPRDFYDYQAKYVSDDTRYILPCGLPPARERALQSLSREAFAALGCRGWGRVDLMLDAAGEPQLLEVNTAPGMTDHSLVPMAARAVGLSYEDLCLRILEAARLG